MDIMKFYIDYDSHPDIGTAKQKIYNIIDNREIDPNELVGKTILSAGCWNSISRNILIEVADSEPIFGEHVREAVKVIKSLFEKDKGEK